MYKFMPIGSYLYPYKKIAYQATKDFYSFHHYAYSYKHSLSNSFVGI